MKKKWNKLVRDKIVLSLEQKGIKVHSKVLNEQKALNALRNKILEEAMEVSRTTTAADTIEEIADIREVIDELMVRMDITEEQIEQARQEKNSAKGAFKNNIYLISTEE